MDKQKRMQMTATLDRMQAEHESRVEEFARDRSISINHARPVVIAMLTLEHLSHRIESQLAMSTGDAKTLAESIAGSEATDSEQISEYGPTQWAFARSLQMLKSVPELMNWDEMIPALTVVGQVASTLMTAMELAAQDERARNSAKGGRVTAERTGAVRERAIELAKKMEPIGGWQSAPQACEAIMAELRAYARERGRNYSARKVEEWLRGAGIKRPVVPTAER